MASTTDTDAPPEHRAPSNDGSASLRAAGQRSEHRGNHDGSRRAPASQSGLLISRPSVHQSACLASHRDELLDRHRSLERIKTLGRAETGNQDPQRLRRRGPSPRHGPIRAIWNSRHGHTAGPPRAGEISWVLMNRCLACIMLRIYGWTASNGKREVDPHGNVAEGRHCFI